MEHMNTSTGRVPDSCTTPGTETVLWFFTLVEKKASRPAERRPHAQRGWRAARAHLGDSRLVLARADDVQAQGRLKLRLGGRPGDVVLHRTHSGVKGPGSPPATAGERTLLPRMRNGVWARRSVPRRPCTPKQTKPRRFDRQRIDTAQSCLHRVPASLPGNAPYPSRRQGKSRHPLAESMNPTAFGLPRGDGRK